MNEVLIYPPPEINVFIFVNETAKNDQCSYCLFNKVYRLKFVILIFTKLI